MSKHLKTPFYSEVNQEAAIGGSVVSYWLILAALIVGVCLSVFSAMHLCSTACAAGHKYRLYGFAFEPLGIAFFSTTAILHGFSKRYAWLSLLVVAMLAVALGAEGMFVYAQKYIIGHWCPICLSIAMTVAIAFSVAGINQANKILNAHSKGHRGEAMKQFIYGSFTVALVASGFLFAEAGFAKFSQLQATENAIKEEVAFGNLQSPIEVYVFTDWQCGACRQIEPILIKSSEAIMKAAKLIFVDFIVHDDSLNFTPYNLAFMVHNKPQYMQLRDGLTAISAKTSAPTEKEIEALAKKEGVKFAPLNYSEVSMANNYFSHLGKQFDVDSTPTVIVVNALNKKGKKLVGGTEITTQNILNAIDALK